MTDWVTIASLLTALGTMVLALATFASVRSANRAARVTERALLARIRPVLVPTRMSDPMEKVGFADQHWMKVEGQRATIEVTDSAIYLAFTLRNAGAGIAVLDRWSLITDFDARGDSHADPDTFRRLTRDIYIPAGDIGFWQGVFRDPDEAIFRELRDVIADRRPLMVDLLYEDHEGGQRTVSRFGMQPRGDDQWITSVSRHWNLDRDDPR